MNYKYYLNSQFAGCRLLAETYDEHRKRDVRVYMVPGQFDVVGVCDGTDSWVAPAIINPFSCDVLGMLKRIASGEDIPPFRNGKAKGQLDLPLAGSPRRRLTTCTEEPKPRRRLQTTAEPVASTRRKLNASA